MRWIFNFLGGRESFQDRAESEISVLERTELKKTQKIKSFLFF